MDKLINANELIKRIDGMDVEVEAFDVICAIAEQPDASSEVFEEIEAETNEGYVYGVLKKPFGRLNGIVIDDGSDVVFPCAKIGGYTTMQACEEMCPRYYQCDTIAIANDLLKDYEYVTSGEESID